VVDFKGCCFRLAIPSCRPTWSILAYYSIFSIGPLLVVALALAGLFYDEAAARGAMATELRVLLGPQAASTIESMLAGAGKPAEGVFAGGVLSFPDIKRTQSGDEKTIFYFVQK
jgi:hypothetical protein